MLVRIVSLAYFDVYFEDDTVGRVELGEDARHVDAGRANCVGAVAVDVAVLRLDARAGRVASTHVEVDVAVVDPGGGRVEQAHLVAHELEAALERHESDVEYLVGLERVDEPLGVGGRMRHDGAKVQRVAVV